MKYGVMISLFLAVIGHSTNVLSESLDYPQVVHVKASQSLDGSWCFDTQVRHDDEGWEHYVDAWQIVNQQGDVLGERVLYHPHVNEQPFTRRLCGVQIPNNATKIAVRAKCNRHGFGESVVIDMTRLKGNRYLIVK